MHACTHTSITHFWPLRRTLTTNVCGGKFVCFYHYHFEVGSFLLLAFSYSWPADRTRSLTRTNEIVDCGMANTHYAPCTSHSRRAGVRSTSESELYIDVIHVDSDRGTMPHVRLHFRSSYTASFGFRVSLFMATLIVYTRSWLVLPQDSRACFHWPVSLFSDNAMVWFDDTAEIHKKTTCRISNCLRKACKFQQDHRFYGTFIPPTSGHSDFLPRNFQSITFTIYTIKYDNSFSVIKMIRSLLSRHRWNPMKKSGGFARLHHVLVERSGRWRVGVTNIELSCFVFFY